MVFCFHAFHYFENLKYFSNFVFETYFLFNTIGLGKVYLQNNWLPAGILVTIWLVMLKFNIIRWKEKRKKI